MNFDESIPLKDQPAQLILFQIMHLNMQRAMQMLEQHHLKPSQAGILFVLERHKTLAQKDLAKYVRLTPPSVTAVLQKMERDGYITREPDERDQRIMRISNTEKGNSCVELIKEVFSDMEGIMFEGMSMEEIILFKRFLVEIGTNLSKVAGLQEGGCQRFPHC